MHQHRIGVQIHGVTGLEHILASGHLHVIFHGFKLVGVVRATLTGNAEAHRVIGNVDIVQVVLFHQMVVHNVLENLIHMFHRTVIVRRGGGEGNGGNAQRICLENGACGAGVDHITADVQTSVDAGDHQVKLFLHAQNGIANAVGGGGVNGVGGDAGGKVHLFYFKRLVDLDAVALAALLIFGNKHSHFAQLLRPLCQGQQALGADAIVVGD